MSDRDHPRKGTACAKTLRQEHPWCVRGQVRRLGWLEQSERGRELGSKETGA